MLHRHSSALGFIAFTPNIITSHKLALFFSRYFEIHLERGFSLLKNTPYLGKNLFFSTSPTPSKARCCVRTGSVQPFSSPPRAEGCKMKYLMLSEPPPGHPHLWVKPNIHTQIKPSSTHKEKKKKKEITQEDLLLHSLPAFRSRE